MAITVNSALRIDKIDSWDGPGTMYKTNGTPVDCVKLAMHSILDRRPDLVATGINHGSNAAVNVVYSGTMGAAMEGCAFGIPSVGFSLTDHNPDADFTPCGPYVKALSEGILKHGLPEGVCLNVNIPNIEGMPDGMRVVRAAKGNWNDEYARYTDPHGHPFYWLTGHFENHEPDARDTDEWCLAHRLVSVVPTMLDRTAPNHAALQWLSDAAGTLAI